jgi:hypothetical protein
MRAWLDLIQILERATRTVAAAVVAIAAWRVAQHVLADRDGSDGDLEVADAPTQPAETSATGSRDEPHIHIDSTAESKANATAAAMAHVLARPDSIRQRAQNAATISSAVAAALVVAGVVQLARDQNESWRWWTIALVSVALISWVVAVWMFVRVVTHGQADPPRDRSYQALVDAYENHSIRLRRRLRRAAAASGVALVVTAIAVMVEVGERTYTRERERQAMLTEGGVSAVAALCGWELAASRADPRVNIRVSSDELSKAIVEVDVLSRPLRTGSRQQVENCMAPTPEMRLARTTIVAVNDVD